MTDLSDLVELMDELLVPRLRALGIDIDSDYIWAVEGLPWEETEQDSLRGTVGYDPWAEAEQDYYEEPVLDDSVELGEEEDH